MSPEKHTVNELNAVLASLRRTQQEIVVREFPEKMKVIEHLITLEEEVKKVRDEITLPPFEITPRTTLDDIAGEDVLSVRAYNVLKRSGIQTVADIISHTPYEIYSMRNMGKKAGDEIISLLARYGLFLKEEEE